MEPRQDLKHRIRPDWHRTLEAIVERARAGGPLAVVAFDLDSTVFDNRPRQARILREFGAARGIPLLAGCQAAHFPTGFDMKGALRNVGLSAEEVEAIYAEARAFWLERFFTSDYCADDDAIDGAAQYLARLLETPARLAYLTGRPEVMREGTLRAMRRHGYPLPDEARVFMLMKPSTHVHDDDFKRTAHDALASLGEVIAAFDNEPTHVNDYRRRFPGAVIVHLATDHSGRPVELDPAVISIPHFRY